MHKLAKHEKLFEGEVDRFGDVIQESDRSSWS